MGEGELPVWDLKIEALVPLPWRQRKCIVERMLRVSDHSVNKIVEP